jgi:protease-4
LNLEKTIPRRGVVSDKGGWPSGRKKPKDWLRNYQLRSEPMFDKKNSESWEQTVIEKLVFDALVEKRRARRWSIFFKFLFFSYLVALVVLWFPDKFNSAELGKLSNQKHTALVELNGVIADKENASADNVVTGLRNAFEDKNTKGVILRINSPGGSPVQSSYINKEIIRLREKYTDIPIYTVVSDMCASGGYYVAAATDRIYVNESSIVGSIGVRMGGFGFVEVMQDLGVERRLMTAGEHKAIGDPFSPLAEDEKAYFQKLLNQLHEEFIAVVKAGRGDRLTQDDDLFNGLFWAGKESIELGLADELGSAGTVARDVIGAEDLVDFTYKERSLERLFERLGAGAAQMLGKVTGINSTPRM